jgi:fido (protein-threonine AMPylation protein)
VVVSDPLFDISEGNSRTWVAFDHATLPVARFHHRLVAIHPFPNGNGRHSRAAADYLSGALELATPSWGANTFDDTTDLRGAYLLTLRAADADPDDLEPLTEFMWS